jgi:butyryl-CoA dehydrogenase
VFGLFSQPTQSAYNASKFAVRGFTESLRLELDIMKCGVSASSVHPGGIKTSIAKRARMNASAGEILGVTPEQAQAAIESRFRTTPEQAAETILRGVQRDARRVLIGVDAWGFDSMARLVPAGYQRLMGELFERRAKHSAH